MLAEKWFPTVQASEYTPELLAHAQFFEKDYWEKMKVAVCNGIAIAFDGNNEE